MAEETAGGTERVIRWTTTFSVVVLAVIAAIVSYKHMYLLVRRYGETSWTAALLPVSVDGMIVASSMSLLLDSRNGRRSGLLPWTLLIIGSTASLAANVAVADPSAVGRLIAGWPSCALIGSYELLMGQIRHAASRAIRSEDTSPYVSPTESEAVSVISEEPHMALSTTRAPSDESLTSSAILPVTSEEPPTDRPPDLMRPADERDRHRGGAERVPEPGSSSGRARRGAAGAQRRAWQWAVAHRTPDGRLPAGKVIAGQFDRSERWGRLVKQAGLAGKLEPAATS